MSFGEGNEVQAPPIRENSKNKEENQDLQSPNSKIGKAVYSIFPVCEKNRRYSTDIPDIRFVYHCVKQYK